MGLFSFAGAADAAQSSGLQLCASSPVPQANWREGANQLESTFFFFYCYRFTAPSPPPPLPLPAFSPPTAPISSPPPPLLPHNLKKEGAARPLPSSGGNSWPPQVPYAGRSRCPARRTRRANRCGRGAEQYPAARRRKRPAERAAEKVAGLRPPPQRPGGGQVELRARGAPADSSELACVLFLAGLPGPRTASALGHRGPAATVIAFCGCLFAWPAPGFRSANERE